MSSRSRSARSLSNSRNASKLAKRRRKGICLDCGGPTKYAGYPGQPMAARCARCAKLRNGQTLIGRGPRQQAALAFLREHGPATYTEIYQAVGISQDAAGMLLGRLLRHGYVERIARGRYQLRGD